MIDTYSMAACVCTLVVSLVLPIGFAVFYSLRHRDKKVGIAWVLGALGFVVPQLLIRAPILQTLGAVNGAGAFMLRHFVLYALFLGFTAGLFEFAGRFLVAKYLAKKGRLNYHTALAAGLGHGGIEAIILVGMTYINNLVLMVMIQSGSFDTLLAQTAAAGADTAALTAARELLLGTSGTLFLLAGFERLLTMIAQVGMSLVVCYSIHTGKARLGFFICVGYHALIDTVAVLFSLLATPQLGSRLSQTASYVIIYGILMAMAALALFTVRAIHDRWGRNQEVYHVPEV